MYLIRNTTEKLHFVNYFKLFILLYNSEFYSNIIKINDNAVVKDTAIFTLTILAK